MKCKDCNKIEVIFLLNNRGKAVKVEKESLSEIELKKANNNEPVRLNDNHKIHDCVLKRGHYIINGFDVWID